MRRAWLLWALALSGGVVGCSNPDAGGDKSPFVNDTGSVMTPTNGGQNSGSNGNGNGSSGSGSSGDASSNGDDATDAGNTGEPAVDGGDLPMADAGSEEPSVDAGEVEADAGSEPPDDPSIDPSNPPKPSPACGTDLDVDNGRVIPSFGALPAQSAFMGDPLANGPYQVVATDKTLDNPDAARNDYNTTAYAPSGDGSSVAAGPFPLLVLVPGFSGNHTGYGHFTNHFVSHGIAVLGVTAANVAFTDAPNNPANVTEILKAVDWALSESPLKGKVDLDKLAIAGHSQGGKLAFFTAAKDPRFKLVIGWDPQNGGGAPCFIAGVVGQNCNAWPVAPSCDTDRSFQDSGMLANMRAESIVFAARDGNTTPDAHLWAENFYRGAPSPAHLVLFPNAGHGDWAATGATTDITKRVQLALIMERMFNKTGLTAYEPTGSYLAGEASVSIHSSK